MVDVSIFGQRRRITDGGVSVTVPAAEFLLGDEAVRLLRAIRQAYYSDSFIWGTAGAGQDDGLRFMQTYERLMCASTPKLRDRLMADGAHSGPTISREQEDDSPYALGPILGIR